MLEYSSFTPAWWLPNSHAQTIWASFLRRLPKLKMRRERLELPDGDFLDLDWVGPETGPRVLVLHGLGGCIDSAYAQGILHAITARGWRGVFMHFRGASGEPNRKARSYHSGETADTQFVVEELLRREPSSRLAAIGYSMGGNVLLKWLGETQGNNPLTAAVAVSVPFQLQIAANHMGSDTSGRFYQWWLLRGLRYAIIKKFQRLPAPIETKDIYQLRSFLDFDNRVTAPLHGFKNAQDYYHQSSSRQYLKKIAIPTLIVHAKDDPFMIPDVVPGNEELSDKVTLELSEGGGHVGFVSGNNPWKPEYWLEQRIPDFLSHYFK